MMDLEGCSFFLLWFGTIPMADDKTADVRLRTGLNFGKDCTTYNNVYIHTLK